MAIVRCKDCRVRSTKYVESVEPLGYPETAAICGSPQCERPGLIWLTTEELAAYRAGQRVFRLATNTTKVSAA